MEENSSCIGMMAPADISQKWATGNRGNGAQQNRK